MLRFRLDKDRAAIVATTDMNTLLFELINLLAAWTLRYCPFVCGSQEEAADFAFRFLATQVRDIERVAKAITKERALHLLPHLARLTRPRGSPC
jgi:hypothetical protein